LQNIPALIGVLLTIGIVWKYASKVLAVVKEVADLLNVLLVALADQKLTKEEIAPLFRVPFTLMGSLRDRLWRTWQSQKVLHSKFTN